MYVNSLHFTLPLTIVRLLATAISTLRCCYSLDIKIIFQSFIVWGAKLWGSWNCHSCSDSLEQIAIIQQHNAALYDTNMVCVSKFISYSMSLFMNFLDRHGCNYLMKHCWVKYVYKCNKCNPKKSYTWMRHKLKPVYIYIFLISDFGNL